MEKELQHKKRMENRLILIRKIKPTTTDLCKMFWGINSTNSVVIPQSLLLRSVVGCNFINI